MRSGCGVYPNVYTDVSAYRDWIDEAAGLSRGVTNLAAQGTCECKIKSCCEDYGNGAPSGPNCALFSDVDRLADALWDRSGVR